MQVSGLLVFDQARCCRSQPVSDCDTVVKGAVETFHDIIAHLATNTHNPHTGASRRTASPHPDPALQATIGLRSLYCRASSGMTI